MVVSSLLFLLQSLGELAMLYFASIGVTGFSRFNKWLSKPNCTKTRIYHQPISVWNMCFCIVVKYACTYIHVCIYGSIHTYIWYDLCISFFPPTLFERLFFLMWHHGEPPRCSRDWHGLVQELRMTWGMLPDYPSRIPVDYPSRIRIFSGLEGLFFGAYLFNRIVFHTKTIGWENPSKDCETS